MNIIFYASKTDFPSSKDMIENILKNRFQIHDYTLYKNENGKPFLTIKKAFSPLFLSVTHTENAYFIAFSSQNIGIDAEKLDRTVNYHSILKKFPLTEREEVTDTSSFLRHWTAKESAIKWLDGSIAKDLNRLLYANEKLFLNGLELPATVNQKEFLGHIVSICQETPEEWNFEKL